MGLSRRVQKLPVFCTLLINVTMRTTHKHQIHSLPRLAHLINYEYEQVITHTLNSKYLFTKTTLSLINILHPPGRGFDTPYSNVRDFFCFTKYKYLIANTKHGRTRVRTEAKNTSYALFQNFDGPIATYVYKALQKKFHIQLPTLYYFIDIFNPYRSNVELNSTVLSVVSHPKSRSNRHITLFYTCFL